MKKSTVQTIAILLLIFGIACVSCSPKVFNPYKYANQKNKCGKY